MTARRSRWIGATGPSIAIALFVSIALLSGVARGADTPIDAPMSLVGPWATDDFSKVAKFLRLQAYQGAAQAQMQLALLYLEGKGVSQDPAEAAKWMRKAAEQGLPEANYDLGVMSLSGNGVPQDSKAAATWMRKAAHQGYLFAQYALAQMYRQGIGVDRDAAMALAWADAAVEHFGQGTRPGFRDKYDALRKAITSELSAEQMQNAARFTSRDGPTPRGVIRNRAELEKSIVYPIGLRHLEREGSVILIVLVGADGRGSDPVVEISSGFSKLDDVVLQALPRAEFEPKLVDGQPVKAWQMIKWTFALR